MIIGFVGTPGSGKTYEAVKKIVDNLKMGREVWTNIDGLQLQESLEAIKNLTDMSDSELSAKLHYLTNEQCSQFWLFVPHGALILVDEVHKLFSNRNWASDQNKDFTEWASTHRHFGNDVVLITQDLEKIDKHARSLIEWTYFFRKVNQFGGIIKNRYSVYSYASDDHNGVPLSHSTRQYDPKIFACYSSYTVANAREIGIMKHVNILKHPVFYAIPVILCLFLYFLMHSSLLAGDIFGSKKAEAAGLAKLVKKPEKQIVVEGKSPVKIDEKIVSSSPVLKSVEHVVSDDVGSSVITEYHLSNNQVLYSNVIDLMLKPGVWVISKVQLSSDK